MHQHVSLVTLIVEDVGRALDFYVDGLRWTPEILVEGEVLMLRVGERLVLSLWDRGHAEAEIGPVARDGAAPITLAHNVASEAEVDAVIATARDAGARIVAEATRREWGGYSGYFADPDGFRWEVAFNPGALGQSLLP